MLKRILSLSILLFLLFAQDNPETETKSIDTSVHISGQWFMAFRGNIPSNGDDSFGLKRGYLTFKKNLNETFSIRYTQDITIDKEGEDAGNVELRFKYCYLKADLPEFLFFKEPFIEIGLVHQPWIEFEQKINSYRVQGKMFMEKYGVTTSADFGFNAVALLGGKLDDETRKKVDSSLPGKYGSVSFGLYNGGGYHAIEVNNNKTVEGRLTLRPFPGLIPGLQFSHGFAIGKGNDTLNTQYHYNVTMISHETKSTTFTIQNYKGVGYHSGVHSLFNEGMSFFGEIFIPRTSIAVFGRYDFFSGNFDSLCSLGPINQTIIGGIAWKFFKNKRLLFDI